MSAQGIGSSCRALRHSATVIQQLEDHGFDDVASGATLFNAGAIIGYQTTKDTCTCRQWPGRGRG